MPVKTKDEKKIAQEGIREDQARDQTFLKQYTCSGGHALMIYLDILIGDGCIWEGISPMYD